MSEGNIEGENRHEKEHHTGSGGPDPLERTRQVAASSAERHTAWGQQPVRRRAINGWIAYLLPILVMGVTDPLVGGYTRTTPVIYLSFLISVWIGRRVRSTDNPMRIGGACLLSSIQFFAFTNFATWMFGSFYAKSFAGLATCYVAALPFLGATMVGDLFFTAAIFVAYARLARYVAHAEAARA